METIYAILLIIISSTGDIEVSTIGRYSQESKNVCDSAATLIEVSTKNIGVPTNAKAFCFAIN